MGFCPDRSELRHNSLIIPLRVLAEPLTLCFSQSSGSEQNVSPVMWIEWCQLFHLSNLCSCSHLKPVLMNWMFGVIWLSRRSFPFEQTSLFAYVTVIRVWKSRVHQMTPPEISAWRLRVLMCRNYCYRPVQASARHAVRWMIITYLTELVREKRWCPARLPDIEDTFQPCCWVANLIKFFVIITSVQ